MTGPITAASLPGSALNAPTPVAPGGGFTPPSGPMPQLNLQAFGATPLPVQNFLAAQPASGPNIQDIANALIASTTPVSNPNSPTDPNGGEGLMSHVMDFLNMGNYAVAGAAEQGIDTKNADLKSHMNPLEAAADTAWNTVLGFGHGIAGGFGDSHPGDKTDWTDVLLKHGPDAALINGTQTTMPDYQQNAANKFLNAQDGGNRPTNLTRAVTPDDIRKAAAANAIEGTGLDIVGDPLNMFNPVGHAVQGIKKAAGMFSGLVGKGSSEVSGAEQLANVLKDFKKVPENVDEFNVGQIKPGESGTEANASAQASVQNAVAGPSPVPPIVKADEPVTSADILGASEAASKIDPEFFNQLLRENMNVGPVAAPEEQAAGAYSKLRDPKMRGAYVNQVIADTLNNDGPRWATHLMSRLMKDYGDVNGLQRTGAFIERMSDRLPNLRNAPLNQIKDSLRKTLEADVVAHIAANKALKAPELIDRVAKGDEAATAATKPASVASSLPPKDAEIAKQIYQKYWKQIIGDGTGFAGMKDENAYRAAVRANRVAKWSGPKQVNMFQDIASAIRKANPGMPVTPVMSRSARILRSVEDFFMHEGQHIGAVPYSGVDKASSIPLRLSEVLYKMNPAIMAKHADLLTTILRSAFGPAGEMPASIMKEAPELKDAFEQAMEAAKAGSAISEAPAAQTGIQTGTQLIDQAIQSGQSDARVSEAKTMAEKVAEDITQKAGGGETTGNAVRKILHDAFVNSDKIQAVTSRNFAKTLSIMSKDDISYNTSNVVQYNQFLHDIFGGPTINNLGKLAGPTANAIGYAGGRIAGSYGLFGQGMHKLFDFLGTKFNPAYGNKDLRPLLVQSTASARAIISHDAGIYNRLYRSLQHDPETLRAGFLAAQGHKAAVAGSDADKWSKQFISHMENLVGSSALRNTGLLADTVAGRAQLLRGELNEAAKRYGLPGKFTNAKDVKDAMGITHDLSKDADWLKSWQTWDVKDPLKFMMQMSNAVNYAVHKAKFWDEVAARFGRPGKTVVDKIPRLKGVYFDTDHAAQVRQVAKFIKDFETPASRAGRLLDMALSKYKTAATMYLPAHHIRALMGDVQLSWLAGNEDVSTYSAATKIMKAQRGRYNAFENSVELTGSDAVANAMARAKGTQPVAALSRGTDTIFTMKNGMHVTADMIYTYMFRHGLLPSANHLLDIPEEDTMAKAFAPFNGKLHDFVHGAAEVREHWIRIAHFVDQMKKAGLTDFESAAEKAASEVRKWHPDGTDLTNFERRVMRRVFPFYSWTRKAVPLVLESIVMRPDKVSLYPRLMYGAGVATGTLDPTQTSEEDPFPTDALFPNWMREKGIGPMFGSASTGYTSITPNIPSMDVIETLGGLTSSDQSERADQWSSWLNPAIRVPEELATGQTLGGSAIVSKKSGMGEYLLRQIPQVQQYSGITNITSTNPEQPAGTLNVDKLLNFLGAMGVENDANYSRQAMYDFMNNQRIQAGTGF